MVFQYNVIIYYNKSEHKNSTKSQAESFGSYVDYGQGKRKHSFGSYKRQTSFGGAEAVQTLRAQIHVCALCERILWRV